MPDQFKQNAMHTRGGSTLVLKLRFLTKFDIHLTQCDCFCRRREMLHHELETVLSSKIKMSIVIAFNSYTETISFSFNPVLQGLFM